MSAHVIHDRKAMMREMFVQQAAHDNADVSSRSLQEDAIRPIKSRREYALESTADRGFYEPVD
jgi:hypothetical protein